MTDINLKAKLSDLLKDPRFEKLELSLQKPNFFQIIGVQNMEIKHSNFLAWLFDPRAAHGLSVLFLKKFFRDVFSTGRLTWIDEFHVDKLNFDKVKVLREWKGIDILIILDEFVVCIENKLYAGEAEGQLKKYRKILKEEFPKQKHVFIFLTKDGRFPDDVEDAGTYIRYSYESLLEHLENVLEIYGQDFAPKVRMYIEDYVCILRRNEMKEDNLIKIVNEIYNGHREALDFILENKPDRIVDAFDVIMEEVSNAGYKPASSSKGYVRFLTEDLDKIIPRTGRELKNKESFVFEIEFWGQKITLKTLIPPGEQKVRTILAQAISSLEGSKKPKGLAWLVHFSWKKNLDVKDEEYQQQDILHKDVADFLKEHKEAIRKVESAILKQRDAL